MGHNIKTYAKFLIDDLQMKHTVLICLNYCLVNNEYYITAKKAILLPEIY